METFTKIVTAIDDFAWGPIMLILLVGTGVYLSIRSGWLQFSKFGYAMKNTLGKAFSKQKAGKGEVTPFQAMTTALAGTVGTGNIAGVTGAIFIGGPGAVFWLWISALVGMVTKYSEVLLAVKYRERNADGDWVGGPMYSIKNGLGKNWLWLAYVFAFFGMIASFGIGNTTQVDSVATNRAFDELTVTAFFTDMLSVGSDAYVGGNGAITGTLNVTGATTLGSTLTVNGATYIYNSFQVGSSATNRNSTFYGYVYIGSATSYINYVSGNSGLHTNVGFYSDSYITAGAAASSSDRRLKDNIDDVCSDRALTVLMQLKPKEWTWNENNAYLYGKRGAGLIAQDVLDVLPFAVVGDAGEYLSLNYNTLHAYEIAGLQNHEARIAALEAENKELKAKLKEYESR